MSTRTTTSSITPRRIRKVPAGISNTPGRSFLPPDPVGSCRKRRFFPGIPAVSKPERDGTGRKYTRNMEAVFRPESYRTRNRHFPNIFHRQDVSGTPPYPSGKSSESPRIHSETTGIFTYPSGNHRI